MKYIITGTSSGLGYWLSKKLISYGEVVGVSRSLGLADKLHQSGQFSHLKFDFSESIDENCFNTLINDLKIFINNQPFAIVLNAGCFYSGIYRLTEKKLMELFHVNIFSIIKLIQALEKPFLRRVFIVNSISGIIGQSHQHEYSASKHAVMGFARSLAKSAKNLDYDVMCINPGGMKTELWKNYLESDTSDFLMPEVMANICVSLILIPQRAFIAQMIILPPSDL